MDQPSPQLPPPFDWSTYHASAGQQPAGPPTFGAPPPPAATLPPSSGGDGGGGRRRHPAHRARIAAAVVSGAAFVGLIGSTALGRSDDATTQQQPDRDQFGADRFGAGEGDDQQDPYSGGYGDSDSFGGDQERRFGGSESFGSGDTTEQFSPPDWGGSATPGSGAPSSGPSTRSQAS